MRLRELFDQELDELTGVKKYHNLTIEELMKQIAEDFNLKLLGQGAFGYVLSTHDPNTVVKIFETDDAYLSFVNFIQQHPNKHYPKITKSPRLMTTFYKRYDIQPDKFTVLVIERLKPLPDKTAAFVSSVANARDLYDKPMYLPNGRMNGGGYDYDTDEIDSGVTYQELARDYPWIPEFWAAVRQMFRGGVVHGNIDMHYGNFMMRDDGTIVITDPVADPKGLQIKRQIDDLKWQGKKPDVQGPRYQQQHLEQPIKTNAAAEASLEITKNNIAQLEANPDRTPKEQKKLDALKLYASRVEAKLKKGKKQ